MQLVPTGHLTTLTYRRELGDCMLVGSLARLSQTWASSPPDDAVRPGLVRPKLPSDRA